MRNGEEEKASVGRSSETFSCEDGAEGKSCKETRGEGVLQRRAALKPIDLLSGVTRWEGESWELRERTRVGRGLGEGPLHCPWSCIAVTRETRRPVRLKIGRGLGSQNGPVPVSQGFYFLNET